MGRRRETPIKRTNPSGATRWVARYTDKDGKRRSAGTFALKREAQDAIDAAYDADENKPININTVGGYFATWLDYHPRAEKTNRTNKGRVEAVLDVKLEGVKLRDWQYDELRRRHATALVDHMLRKQGRAYTGAQNILRTLSAMTEDAINDDVVTHANPFKGVKVRANDPRIQKETDPVRVWSWEQMHAFAAECGKTLPQVGIMARVLSDCGLRIGELFGLYRADLDVAAATLHVRRTASTDTAELTVGTKADRLRGKAHGEGRLVPVPPALLAMLVAMPKRIDTPLLFPSPSGRVWWYPDWRRAGWNAAQQSLGIDPRPHEFRHSYASLMRAAGVDPADLAEVMGHSVETATARYTHALGRSNDAIRMAVGE